MPDLSVLIAARNEMFLKRTIDDVLANARGDTEVIAVLDGTWADPAIPDHPRVQLVYRPSSIGQRAAVNLAARLSTARYVMKLDAHCSVAEGFDVALMAADQEIGRPDVTQIPRLYNLHGFDWQCTGCGHRSYQGPTPGVCEVCKKPISHERVMVWQPRLNRRTDFARFDHDLHFQYWSSYSRRPAAQGELADVMSSVGACFFMRRSRFQEIGGLDEAHGSWGQFGTEVACKSWLSGGLHVVNKRTWFAHLFRTQGGDFGFPYPMQASAQQRAREYSQQMWREGRWAGARLPLSWLIDKFAPVPDWTEERVTALEAKENHEITNRRRGRGAEDQATRTTHTERSRVPSGRGDQGTAAGAEAAEESGGLPVTKGLAYYSDCRGDARILQAVRDQVKRAAPDLPLVAVTLALLDDDFFGHQLLQWQGGLVAPRGQLTMFRQILTALEALDTDVVFFVEHDVLYHPSHFKFTPPRRDRFYYNQNRWQVDAETGRAVHYLCCQTAELCADRQLLIEHYRRRIAAVAAAGGYNRNMGYEPGTNAWARSLDGVGHDTWMSPFPNIDIRHGRNLSKTRWSQAEFRNKNSCRGWTEGDGVPGWGRTLGRFNDFLADVGRAASATEGAA